MDEPFFSGPFKITMYGKALEEDDPEVRRPA